MKKRSVLLLIDSINTKAERRKDNRFSESLLTSAFSRLEPRVVSGTALAAGRAFHRRLAGNGTYFRK